MSDGNERLVTANNEIPLIMFQCALVRIVREVATLALSDAECVRVRLVVQTAGVTELFTFEFIWSTAVANTEGF